MAILSTLGLAPRLADVLRDRDRLDAVFGLGMLLVVVTVVTLALKARPGGIEVGVMLGIAATYLLVFGRTGLPAEERTQRQLPRCRRASPAGSG